MGEYDDMDVALEALEAHWAKEHKDEMKEAA